MQLKEFKQNIEVLSGGICPECGRRNKDNDGVSIAADEGSFFWCSYCGAPSVLIYSGARFMDKPREVKDKVIRVYEIVGDILPGDNTLISCIEVRLINASHLAKINKTHYQYYSRKNIIEFMSENYREDL